MGRHNRFLPVPRLTKLYQDYGFGDAKKKISQNLKVNTVMDAM